MSGTVSLQSTVDTGHDDMIVSTSRVPCMLCTHII